MVTHYAHAVLINAFITIANTYNTSSYDTIGTKVKDVRC